MFSDPYAIVQKIPITQGMHVADLGAGTGAFAFALASKVGPTGKVFACEVQKDLVTRIMNEIHERGTQQVTAVHANIEQAQGTRLRDSSIDWAVVANVLFQIDHKDIFAQEVMRILKSGGSLLVIDWSESFGNMGPHAKDIISQTDTEKLFTAHGFTKTPLIVEAGAHHYAIVFKK